MKKDDIHDGRAPLKAFAYARANAETLAVGLQAILYQLGQIADFASRRNIELVRCFVDPNDRGDPGRSDFTAMIEEAADPLRPIDYIVVQSRLQLERPCAESVWANHQLLMAGVGVLYVDDVTADGGGEDWVRKLKADWLARAKGEER